MLLEVDIEKRYNDFLLKVDFKTDNITGVLGSSGQGKSLLLKCIAGIEKPDSGKIVLNGEVLFDSKLKINKKIQDRKIGYMFQNYALFPHLTVKQNIEICLDSKISFDDIINRFHIKDILNQYPNELSGGQQQRVALARMIASNPKILMFDEPFSALDKNLRFTLEEELINLLKDFDGISFFISHNPKEIYRICNDVLVLENGKMDCFCKKDELFKNPKTHIMAKIIGIENIIQTDSGYMAVRAKDVLIGEKDFYSKNAIIENVIKDIDKIIVVLNYNNNKIISHISYDDFKSILNKNISFEFKSVKLVS